MNLLLAHPVCQKRTCSPPSRGGNNGLTWIVVLLLSGSIGAPCWATTKRSRKQNAPIKTTTKIRQLPRDAPPWQVAAERTNSKVVDSMLADPQFIRSVKFYAEWKGRDDKKHQYLELPQSFTFSRDTRVSIAHPGGRGHLGLWFRALMGRAERQSGKMLETVRRIVKEAHFLGEKAPHELAFEIDSPEAERFLDSLRNHGLTDAALEVYGGYLSDTMFGVAVAKEVAVGVRIRLP